MSTGSTQPFRASGTTVVAATTSIASGALVGSGDAALILNASSGIAIVSFGRGVGDSPNGPSVPIPAGARMLMHTGSGVAAASVTLVTGTGNVYITLGTGTVY